ncbi:hypothetical protein GCM10022243_08260 [Saccharothrix violaceirubra]|uniref:Uncharacterized protein n=1 Tax=Saccharothrix violaceirubra TaxID=413306 RepID=A0A7W7SYD5_9PSEU|nr:hypothetical protein [Saccharothrix violaceirubra]MBB4963238.1 hypothetical protein [Saccharothrix violaceirubra]
MKRKVFVVLAFLGVVLAPVGGLFGKADHAGWVGAVGMAVGGIAFPFAVTLVSRRLWPLFAGLLAGLFAVLAGMFFAPSLWLKVDAETLTGCEVVDERTVTSTKSPSTTVSTVDCAGERFEIVPFTSSSEFVGKVGSETTLLVDRTGLLKPVRPSDVESAAVWVVPLAVLLQLALVVVVLRLPPPKEEK